MCNLHGMNQFATYVRDAGLSQKAMADTLGVDPSIISRLAAGKMKPGLDLAVAIERATNGKVTAVSWVPVCTGLPVDETKGAA